MAEPRPGDITGPESEQTDLGQVLRKLLDFFEAMDLPKSIEGARLIVMLDTDDEGTIAASGYDDYRDVATNIIVHFKALLRQVGMDVDVIGEDQLRAMFGGSQN